MLSCMSFDLLLTVNAGCADGLCDPTFFHDAFTGLALPAALPALCILTRQTPRVLIGQCPDLPITEEMYKKAFIINIRHGSKRI